MTLRWSGILSITLAITQIAGAASKPAGGEPPRPDIDAEGIIEKSYNFLEEREPTMTEAEYALYERVVPMVRLQPELALPLLEGMIGEEDTSAAFDLALGNVYFEQKRYAEAEERFKEAVRKYPNFIRGWDNLGMFYFSTERFEEAVPCLSRVVSLGGWEPRIFGLLGFCLAKSGDPIAAEMAYSQAYALESDNSDWIEGLVQVLLASKQYDRVEPLVRRLTRLEPENTEHWMLLANVLILDERRLDAAVVLDVAASLDVLDTDGLELLGDLYADAGFFPEAVNVYRRVAERDPEAGAARLLRYARVLVDSGRAAEAGPLLDEAELLADDEQRVELLQARASILIAEQAWSEARVVLEKLLESDPLNGPALLQLAEVQVAEGNESAAAFTLESATHLPESAYMASLHLARLKVKTHDYSEALALLDDALEVQDSPLIRNYRAQVEVLASTAR